MTESERDRKYLLLGLRIVGEFGAVIAVPVVLLAKLGQWLDGRYGTAPWFLVGGFLLAALLSGLSLWQRAKQFGQEYQALDAKPSDGGTDDSSTEA